MLGAIAAIVLIAGTTAGILVARSGDDVSSGRPAAIAGRSSPPLTPRTSTAPKTSSSASSSAPTDFASVYSRQQSGVVRIEVLGCSESGIGTGFLLSPTLVATVDHVITDSLVVSLIDGAQRTTGRVIGEDPSRDLALVQAEQPISGYHFHFATASPMVGQRVAAIGFPIGDPITLTQGGVSGLDRSVDVAGHPRSGLIETDAAVNPGNSGGPLLELDGSVVGLVDALNTQANGIAYAVPAGQARPAMQTWERAPQPAPTASCETPLGPSQDTSSISGIPDLDAGASAGISQAMNTYFNGINTGDYASAYAVFSPRVRQKFTEQSFADGDATSYDFDQTIISAHELDSATANVAIEFTSIQESSKGPNGDVCDVWRLRYRMIEGADGSWYIDGVQPYSGADHHTC